MLRVLPDYEKRLKNFEPSIARRPRISNKLERCGVQLEQTNESKKGEDLQNLSGLPPSRL